MRNVAIRFCYLFLATLLGSALFADTLPRPIGVAFDKGALFTVAGYTGASPLSGFPVLVRIKVNSPAGFFYTDLHSQTDGADIAFVDMEGNGLPFEIDTWDPNGTSLIWVRLPTMTNGTQFVMCWGSAESGKAVCADSPFADYVGVWHMSEANGAIADSSGHGRDAVPAGTNAESLSIAGDGPVGNGRQCAANAYLSVANAAAMNVGNTFAVSGWFFQSTNQTSDARLFSRKIRNQQYNNGWEVICKYLKTNPPYSQFSARGAGDSNKADFDMHGVWSAYGWQHLTIVYNGTKASIYLDGECIVDASDINEATDNDNSLSIGSYSGGESSYFIGSVDECRILDAVPTADWVAADCATVTNAAFLSAGKAVYFDGATTPVPAIELVGVEYNAENYTADVDYSVVWTGYGCQDVDVLIAWGYAPTDLVHTNAVATCTAGPGHCAVPLFKDEVTIYIKAIVTNELGYVGISADVAELYVEKNDKAQEEKVPILSDVGISRVDGVYAVITGVVASVGNYTGDVPQCAIRLWYGEDPASPSSVVESVVGLGPFALNAMNLQVGVQYGCRVEMEDAAGEHVESAAMTFTTKGPFELGEVVSSAIEQTITVSSSNGVVGASTTYVFAKWDDGDWTLVETFDVDSPSLEFEATYLAPTWSKAVAWQIMVSNECLTVEGEPTGIFWTNVVAGTQMPIDDRIYYWQPVDEDWNGDWDDPAHWRHSGGDGGQGYPDNASSTASFEDCRAANPVVVNVNGNYTIKLLVPYGKSAASSVRFKGNGRDVSGITSASFPSYTDGVTPAYPIAANTTMEFFDMTVVRGGPWEVIRSGGGTLNHSDITNVTMRLSGTTMMTTAESYFAFATPYSRLELLNYSTNIFSKSCFGGTNAVVVIDNSYMRANGNGSMGILLPQDVYGEGLFVLRGQDAVVESAGGFGTHNNEANARIVLDVPVGGFRNPPIVLTGNYKFAAPTGGGATKLSFEVSEKSPALRKSHAHLSNMVIVQTKLGIDTNHMDGAIGTVPVHSGVLCGEFKYGADGDPLADGASLSTARQILLDLNGYGGRALFIHLR